jgi:hypothetical protein
MNAGTQLKFGVCATVLLACAGLCAGAALAEDHLHHHAREAHDRSERGHGGRGWGDSGLHAGHDLDRHHHHDHFFPAPGIAVRTIEHEHHKFFHHGVHYFYGGGVWYRHLNQRFVVVAPPLGIVVPFLPPFASMVWVGGVPCYYANNVYYAPGPQGYTVIQGPPLVTAPGSPPGESLPLSSDVTELGPATAPHVLAQAPSTQLYVYPRQGQSAELQTQDRAECHDWALGQVGSASGSDYGRALSACLDGRGYTVK